MLKKFIFDLHHFGEGVGSADGGNSTTAESGFEGSAAEGNEQTENNPVAEDKTEDRQKAYNDFIEAHKDLYQKDFDDKIGKRLHKSREEASHLQGEIDKLKPIADELMYQYGVKTPEDALQAYYNDKDRLSRKAYENGLTDEQQKQMEAIERESRINAEKARINAEKVAQYEQQQQDQAKASRWYAQEAEMRLRYPNFSLQTEMQNPEFGKLLNVGVDMATAYQVIHNNEIMTNALHRNTEDVRKQVTNDIMARGARPTENGVNSVGVTHKVDVSKMSNSDLAEIEKKVMRGEQIIL